MSTSIKSKPNNQEAVEQAEEESRLSQFSYSKLRFRVEKMTDADLL